MTPARSDNQVRAARRVALAAGFGGMLEYYDFYLYGALSATIFGTLFFPSEDPAVGTLLALATFGVGFVARPLGGVLAGHVGDRVGRKVVLVVTLALMGLTTLGIGLLPTYDSIGVAAPIMLVTLRVVQGLAHGGEWGGAAVMTVEHAPEGRRGFYGSWPQLGIYAGLLLATVVLGAFMLIPEEQFLDWGWRIPFIIGVLLVFVGLWLRRSVSESPDFAAVGAEDAGPAPTRTPVLEVLRGNPGGVFITFAAKAAETCTFYLVTVFALTLAAQGSGEDFARSGILVAALVAAATVTAFGALSDRIGRRAVYVGGAGFMVVFAFPFFWLASSSSSWGLWLALIVALAVGHAAMYGAQGAYFSELFDPRVRVSGVSLGYQLGAALVGGFTPLIAAALLLRSGGATWPIAVYISAVCLFTVVVLALRGAVHQPLGSPPAPVAGTAMSSPSSAPTSPEARP